VNARHSQPILAALAAAAAVAVAALAASVTPAAGPAPAAQDSASTEVSRSGAAPASLTGARQDEQAREREGQPAADQRHRDLHACLARMGYEVTGSAETGYTIRLKAGGRDQLLTDQKKCVPDTQRR
jgi:hypothetical protein